jgi:hypothetical protein
VDTVEVPSVYRIEAKSAIEALFPAARMLEEQYSADFVPEKVDVGCPVEPVRLGASDCEFGECSRRVSEAGRYSLFVYVVPEDDIQRIGVTNRYWVEEMECEGDSCDEVSSGIYLSPAELKESDLLTYWIYQGSTMDCFVPQDLDLPFPTGEPC